jgi:hypothetical protein
MFIHIGGDKMIRTNDVIAILDISIEQSSKISKLFLQEARLSKKIDVVGSEESKSVVIANSIIYFSPVSTSTLRKRIDQLTTD